jgi:hypothetical protein
VLDIYDAFASDTAPDRFTRDFLVGKKLKKLSIMTNELLRSVQFWERLGHHIHGEIWATNIKEVLKQNQLLDRPIHVISANMHSVMNSILPLRY